MRESSGVQPAQLTCEWLEKGVPTWIVPDISQMVEHGVIEKGDKKMVNGDMCREWKVTTRAGDYFEHRTLCIGVDDHLLKEMQGDVNRRRWTYAFNTPIQINPPSNIAP